MRFRKPVLVLPLSAAVIVALVVYKLSRSYPDQSQELTTRTPMRPARPFEALDSNNQLVKFERYVGRHRMIVVFFDGDLGADKDPTLLRLRRDFDKIEATGAVVVAISGALPQQNRKSFKQNGPFPFPILSDPGPFYSIHKLWGRLDEATGQPLQGVFEVDRAGRVAWSDRGPQPANNLDELIQNVLSGG